MKVPEPYQAGVLEVERAGEVMRTDREPAAVEYDRGRPDSSHRPENLREMPSPVRERMQKFSSSGKSVQAAPHCKALAMISTRSGAKV